MSQEMVEFLLEEASQARRQAVELAGLLVVARLLATGKPLDAGLADHLAARLEELPASAGLQDVETYFGRVDAIEAGSAGSVSEPPPRVHLDDESQESLLLWLETAEHHAELVRGGASHQERQANRQDFEDLRRLFDQQAVAGLARALVERLHAQV
ncbi:MAG: hypothetical protein KC910_09425 [Candidatus Eremiobacteraeota bacterium]|nr:hypothetical protein [Candidatus Eremiobacteraeota bacterium]